MNVNRPSALDKGMRITRYARGRKRKRKKPKKGK